MNGPQHFAAAGAALEKAESESGPRGDVAQFNKHMRLHAAHLAMAQFALNAAAAANTGSLSSAAEVHSEATQARTDALHANYAAWVAVLTEGGAK